MQKAVPLLLCLLSALACNSPTCGKEADFPGPARRLEFVYTALIGPFPDDAGQAEIFIPLAREDAWQVVHERDIDTSIEGRIETEARHGNVFWHATVPHAAGQTVTVKITHDVTRRPRVTRPPDSAPLLASKERKALADFLGPNDRVPVGHRILDPILQEIRQATGATDRAKLARGIYDWVVDNVEYKKMGTGWGNGDTFWACNQRYGNCTDFHSLFISLARTEEIPARFEMGFAVPTDHPAGTIGGYHCWLELHLGGEGWIPVDASEASRDPASRDELYGTQPADRILFTTGRDLRLGPGHRGPDLNYFIYPHVEVDDEPWDGAIDTTFTYREIAKSR